MADNLWEPELLAELNLCTRKYVFDWNRISAHMQQFSAGKQTNPATITPEECRVQFAKLNSVKLPNVVSGENHQPQSLTQAEMEAEAADAAAKRSKPIPTIYDHLTLEELMETVEENERKMKIQKEQIFQRVLDSLGGEEQPTMQLLADPAITAYQESIAKRQAALKLQQQKAEDAIEKEKLLKERETLKNRFNPDSEDARGEYPESLKPPTNQKPQPSANSVDKIPDIDYQPRTESEHHFINNFSIETLVQHEEFDRILSELEKELDSQAIGKDDGNVTELGEVLQFLETSAQQKEKTQKQKAHDDKAISASLPLPPLFPQQKKEASASAAPQPPVSSSSAGPPPAPVKETPKVQVTEQGRTVTYQGRLSHEDTPSNGATGSRRAGVENDDDKEEEEGEEEEDDDINWRNRRKAMKSKVEERQQQKENAPPQLFPPAPEARFNARQVSESEDPDTLTPLDSRESKQAGLSVKSPEKPVVAVNEEPIVADYSPTKNQPTYHEINKDILQRTDVLVEEIMPMIDVESVPNSSGSLLNLANSANRRIKGKKK